MCEYKEIPLSPVSSVSSMSSCNDDDEELAETMVGNPNVRPPKKNDAPVMGVPIRFGPSYYPPPSIQPKLSWCKKQGCDIMLPSDLPYCGIHKCRAWNCKLSNIMGSIYCVEHHLEARERDFEQRLQPSGWTLL